MEKGEAINKRKLEFDKNGSAIGTFVDFLQEKNGKSTSNSGFLTFKARANEEESRTSPEQSPIQKAEASHCVSSGDIGAKKPQLDERKLKKRGSAISAVEMMKERFSKLLLGEDMSGCGNGVCTALALSNAILDLYATLFGQLWKLEPLTPENKVMWQREMEWLLCVSDHIVEFTPSWQEHPDGSKIEVMICRHGADLSVNLPALRKLDNLLIETLDRFKDAEFWYVKEGILALQADESSSFPGQLTGQEGKCWLPVPQVPPEGLSENSRKQLQHKRDCTNQILKAAIAINSATLAEMKIPDSYLELLPKNARASLGDLIYGYITSDQFSPEFVLDSLDFSIEHQALEVANRVEASINVWHQRTNPKPTGNTSQSTSRSSWEVVKELMIDAGKSELLAERGENLLLCLKQRFPGLQQTNLEISKVQFNKDVGKSILESYSRVLESLAADVLARIDDLLYTDDMRKQWDQFMSISKGGSTADRSILVPYWVPVPSIPYKTAGSAKVEISPFITKSKLLHQRFSLKKIFLDFVSKTKGKDNTDNPIEGAELMAKTSARPTLGSVLRLTTFGIWKEHPLTILISKPLNLL